MTRHWHFLGIALLAAAPLSAQSTVVVTPSNPHGWHYTDQDHAGTATINSTEPRSGNGSLEISAPTTSDKAYYGVNFAPQSLSSVTSASFDWYRNGTSTAPGDLAPSYHFLIATNNGTSTQYSELVWEWAYNNPQNSSGTAPVNQWVTSNILGDDFWRSMGGATNTNCQPVNTAGGSQKNSTLAQWNADCYGGNAMVYGISVGYGHGPSGSMDGFADNMNVGFSGASTTYNFEPDAVTTTPEPGSLALLGTGLFGLIPMIRRRRK